MFQIFTQMVFLVSLVSFGSTDISEVVLKEGSNQFGRGPLFNIQDQHVSRKLAEIMVSSSSKTVTIRMVFIINSSLF